MALSGSIKLTYDVIETRTGDLAITGSAPLRKEFSWSFATGVGADQADVIGVDERVVTTGATDTLDFAGSATLLSPLTGVAVPMVKIKSFLIYSLPANTTNLTVQRHATTGVPIYAAAGDGEILGPGDFTVMTRRGAAGVAVTGGTGDIIEVVNAAGASATYQVIAIGTSA